MRTTLTLDDDVARILEAEAHRQRRSFKEVVNEALRRGLSPGRAARATPFKVKVFPGRLRPGLDAGSLNRLADEVETEATIRRLARRR